MITIPFSDDITKILGIDIIVYKDNNIVFQDITDNITFNTSSIEINIPLENGVYHIVSDRDCYTLGGIDYELNYSFTYSGQGIDVTANIPTELYINEIYNFTCTPIGVKKIEWECEEASVINKNSNTATFIFTQAVNLDIKINYWDYNNIKRTKYFNRDILTREKSIVIGYGSVESANTTEVLELDLYKQPQGNILVVSNEITLTSGLYEIYVKDNSFGKLDVASIKLKNNTNEYTLLDETENILTIVSGVYKVEVEINNSLGVKYFSNLYLDFKKL